MKPRTARQVTAALAVAATAALHLWWAVAGTVAIVIAVWLFRLRRHPMGPCWNPSCKAGRNPGSDVSQWGRCARCLRTPGGSGEEPRIGAVLMHPELRRSK